MGRVIIVNPGAAAVALVLAVLQSWGYLLCTGMSESDLRTRGISWPVWVGLALVGITALAVLGLAALRLRATSAQLLPTYGQIADFTLTNENGGTVSLTDLRGHVWVADIIFTRCPGPCLKMTRQMKELQEALPPASQAKLVTLTTDPDFDTPEVLKAYAQRFGAQPGRWTFLTGTKAQIAKLAIDSLKLTAIPKQPEERASPEDLFVHSTIFVIADKRGQLRGVFETTGEGIDPVQVKSEILAAVRRLEDES
jgi:protein SCO1